ncbi:MAG: bifunctional phosphoserine phosphatase/homoserine phosphotransferase ThrH [Chloroflexota bacterium]
MKIACLDLEGVLVPEIWINFAEATGIDALRATTRDVPDYDVLMRQRLRILEEHHLRLPDIQAVIAKMAPLHGAVDFLGWLRERYQVILLSDTFYEFATPLMEHLGYPALLCHHLEATSDGRLTGYRLRQEDSKRMAVKAFHSLGYEVVAAGDSYNDTGMLAEADVGILYCPPDNVAAEFPQFPAALNYDQLRKAFLDANNRLGE